MVPDGYMIWRRREQGEFAELRPIFVVEVDDATTYTDRSAKESGTYEYAVQSIFLDGRAYSLFRVCEGASG